MAISRLSWKIVDLHKQVNGDIASLRKQLHDDIVKLVGRDTDKSERLERWEERSKG